MYGVSRNALSIVRDGRKERGERKRERERGGGEYERRECLLIGKVRVHSMRSEVT